MSCTISVQTLEWHEPHPVEVSVVLENQSKAELNAPVVPSFDLEPLPRVADPLESQWRYCEALWDLEKGTTLPVSSTAPLHLKPGEPRKITSDISELLWTRLIWSVLPYRKLFSVVPAGRYSLHLKLTGKDGKTLCSSNAVEVVVK